MKNVTALMARLDRLDVFEAGKGVTLDELGALAPYLNLTHAVQVLVPAGVRSSVGIWPVHLANTQRVLQDTPNNVIQAYFMWKLISALAPWVGANITTRIVHNETPGPSPGLPTCIAAIEGPSWGDIPDMGALTWTLGRFFVEQAFPESSRRAVEEHLDAVQEQLLSIVRQKEWMTAASVKAVEKTFSRLTRRLGFPSFSSDPILMQTRGINGTTSHVDNVLALARADQARQWRPLAPRIREEPFPLSPTTVNAQYSHYDGLITVPAGIAQYPNLASGLPAHVTYGIFGTILAHELTHAVDERFTSGWDSTSAAALRNHTACLAKQFNAISAGVPLDGAKMQRENVADQGGLHAAFAAWSKLGPDSSLPGMDDFTHEQVFFLSWAQGWCEVATPAFLLRQAKATHAPRFARVLGSLANSRAFREAFNCPREPTCDVW
jgi:endothelin-converting enzyme